MITNTAARSPKREFVAKKEAIATEEECVNPYSLYFKIYSDSNKDKISDYCSRYEDPKNKSLKQSDFKFIGLADNLEVARKLIQNIMKDFLSKDKKKRATFRFFHSGVQYNYETHSEEYGKLTLCFGIFKPRTKKTDNNGGSTLGFALRVIGDYQTDVLSARETAMWLYDGLYDGVNANA